ncbi:GL15750 [Drosophila persimilis]|uniref:GL15750 n=1 Tax=Drosophila persimilis TaxID=7234 RepID=B4HCS4_DROPE|nr:GL15750 [Drosophila persimilis]
MSVPEQSLLDVNINRVQRWKFWKRWSLEYLVSLQPRTKWQQESNNITVDTHVVLKELNQPPSKWMLGRSSSLPRREEFIRDLLPNFLGFPCSEQSFRGAAYKAVIHRVLQGDKRMSGRLVTTVDSERGTGVSGSWLPLDPRRLCFSPWIQCPKRRGRRLSRSTVSRQQALRGEDRKANRANPRRGPQGRPGYRDGGMESDIAAGRPLGTGDPLTTPAGVASASKDRPNFQEKRRATFIRGNDDLVFLASAQRIESRRWAKTVLPDYQPAKAGKAAAKAPSHRQRSAEDTTTQVQQAKRTKTLSNRSFAEVARGKTLIVVLDRGSKDGQVPRDKWHLVDNELQDVLLRSFSFVVI